jgi:formylglycine-generating enzyme required for sulfatase activity
VYKFAEFSNNKVFKPVYGNDATPANSLGLYNMSGNVMEWCSDYFNLDTYENILKSGNNVNPQGESDNGGSSDILREEGFIEGGII